MGLALRGGVAGDFLIAVWRMLEERSAVGILKSRKSSVEGERECDALAHEQQWALRNILLIFAHLLLPANETRLYHTTHANSAIRGQCGRFNWVVGT